MESVQEVVIVSDSGNKDYNCVMYEINHGAEIESYKEGNSGVRALDVIGEDYIISAFQDKPKLKIWQFGEPNTSYRRMTSPGVISVLAVTKCGRYCVAGIGRTVVIWEIASGILENQFNYHHKDVTCIRFSSDSVYLLTGSEDGTVHVYLLSEAIIARRKNPDHRPEAKHIWNQHSAEITDMYVGCLGSYSRVATVSTDSTCRIYELDTGNHLFCIFTNAPLKAVTMDICEYFLFLGTSHGDIYRVDMFHTAEPTIHVEEDEEIKFSGHEKAITSLCVSPSGKYLVSGSTDKTCRIWDLNNFKLVRCFPRSGPVTNVIAMFLPPGIRNKKYMPNLITSAFKTDIDNEAEKEGRLTFIQKQSLSLFHAGAPDQYFDSRVLDCSTSELEDMMKRSNLTMDELEFMNNGMFTYALSKVLRETIAATEESEGSTNE